MVAVASLEAVEEVVKPVVDVVEQRVELIAATEQSDMDAPSKEALIALVEHAEALGNSFQLINRRLVSREEQLVKLSTGNATLMAKNDDLQSQLAFYTEQGDMNGRLEVANGELNARIQVQIRQI